MAGTIYGSRDRNPFNVPETFKVNGVDTKSNIKQDRKFYPLVDSVTGDITIKEYNGLFPSSTGGNTSLDRTIGTIPKDNSFQPVPGQTTFDEIAYFNSAVGQKSVKNHAVITAQKAGAQNAQQLIFPNSAAPGAGQGQNIPPQGGNPPANPTDPTTRTTTIDQLNQLSTKGIPGKPPKKNYENLRYPEDMKNMDVVKFTSKTYGTRSINSENLRFGDRNYERLGGSVTLSIQPSISDLNTVNWGGLEMNFLEMALSKAGLSFIENGAAGLEKFAESAIKTLELEEGVKNALITLIAQEGAGTKGLLSRLTGAISNPNLELLFQGPQLRTHNYNFKLSPRNNPEARQVKKIINFFKRNMAVQRTETALFLKAPNVFDIQYLYAEGKENHKGLNKIKTCALMSCNVNYTPTGSYMTFKDDETQSMVSYDLSLTFQELEPVYEDEYKDENPVTEIGY
jgi:hypothetical protein